MNKNNKIGEQLLIFSELVNSPVIISNAFKPSEIVHINSAGTELVKGIFNSVSDFISQVSSFSGFYKKIISQNNLAPVYNDALTKKRILEDLFISFTTDTNILYSMLLKISVLQDEDNKDKFIITTINNISDMFSYRSELHYSRKYLEGFIEAFARDRMAYLLAYGHEETVRHLMEVSGFSKLIAQKIMFNTGIQNKPVLEYSKITPLYIKILEISALLHDIGKIHHEIHPIIKLPRKLTQAEYNKVKEHAVFGSEIIGNNEILRMCKFVARHHHEKWDGTGYPDGLKENEIPLSARIVAFADMFSALRDERAYKKAITDLDEILKNFYECESSFDPVVFKAGIELIPEMLEKTSSIEAQYKNLKITSETFTGFFRGIVYS
ncbi:MAG TPA: HD domain-containing protein [Spirochaetota bacterium]|nr:HD domain-containing protein [Spirochaetota bacterium]